MTIQEVHNIFGQAAISEQFKKKLVLNPNETIMGFNLTFEEVNAFRVGAAIAADTGGDIEKQYTTIAKRVRDILKIPE